MLHRRLVVDIDDTISVTTSRDWENAKPNIPLINKLNNLKLNGWTVDYYTARGSISCKTRTEAKEKYESIILKWFKENGVLFDTLSFEKPLAAYYIDDKAIRPDEFLELELEILDGGLSGALVERRNDLVYKTHNNSYETAAWYEYVSDVLPNNIPTVHSVIGDTIAMDYIKGRQANIDDVPNILNIVKSFSKMKSMYNSDFNTYIERVKSHLSLYKPDYVDKIVDLLNIFDYNKETSFCHGDLTLSNLIVSDNIYLIDPNVPKNVWCSWMLDVSKLMMHLELNNISYDFTEYDTFEMNVLKITHYIRLRKYSDIKTIKIIDEKIKKELSILEGT